MSQNSPGPTDQDSQRNEPENPRYDGWPVEGYDETDGSETSYVGMAGPIGDTGAGGSMAVVYDEDANTIFEATVDEERHRLVPESGTERELTAVSPDDSDNPIGDALEDLGDRFDWDSLSEFARERLQDTETDPVDARTEPEGEGIEPEAMTFTRSNVAPSAEIDMECTGSFTYRRDDDQVFVVERDFEITFDDPDSPQTAHVDVLERLLRAEDPQDERRAGDAKPLEENTLTFTIELDAEAKNRRIETVVEEYCEEWHESNVQAL
ncbi:hypothetical protein [Natronoglomus mannanivorans]|uniref:Uncharacterized protein n=1 Tax=Natronoglomus mannanivorans TaxID=2979990 RepID=A0AAP3E0M9_9EURY|nr:hypothetical protein [Halobacteria archaeon AArc-xg1-1]